MAPPKRTFPSRLPQQTRHLVWVVLFSLPTMGAHSWQLRISANSPTVNTNLWVGNKKPGHLQRPCHSKVQSEGTVRAFSLYKYLDLCTILLIQFQGAPDTHCYFMWPSDTLRNHNMIVINFVIEPTEGNRHGSNKRPVNHSTLLLKASQGDSFDSSSLTLFPAYFSRTLASWNTPLDLQSATTLSDFSFSFAAELI